MVPTYNKEAVNSDKKKYQIIHMAPHTVLPYVENNRITLEGVGKMFIYTL